MGLAVLGAGSAALFAFQGQWDDDLLFHAAGRLLKADIDVQPQVLSGPRSTFPASFEEFEEIAELRPRHVAEDIAQVLFMREVLPGEIALLIELARDTGAAVVVIELPFLRVHQDLVRLRDVLEPLLSVLLVLTGHIGVELSCQLSVGRFYVIGAGILGNTQGLVVIFFSAMRVSSYHRPSYFIVMVDGTT